MTTFTLASIYFCVATINPTLDTNKHSTLHNDTIVPKISCTEKLRKNPDGKDPIIIKTCLLRKFKIVTIGTPDYKGRYGYEYIVYKKINNQFIKSSNSQIFNEKQSELLSIINQRIQAEFKEYATASDTKDCFTMVTSLPSYKMNDLGISFQGDEIWFSVEFDISSACMSVGGSIANFKLSEISKYLK